MIHSRNAIGVPIEVLPVLMIEKGSEDLEGLLPNGMPPLFPAESARFKYRMTTSQVRAD